MTLTGVAGQASLPASCPVCAHTPLDADLCKPNKALRTTLKAFLRTEEKKRERERPLANPAAEQVAPTTVTPSQTTTPAAAPFHSNGVTEPPPPDQSENRVPVGVATENEKSELIGVMSPIANGAVSTGNEASPMEQHNATEAQAESTDIAVDANSIPPQIPSQSVVDQTPVAGGEGKAPQDPSQTCQLLDNGMEMGVGMGTNNSNGFQSMGWQGPSDFNQMVPPFMANGMQAGGMMPFPNQMVPTGMPGMGIDPMVASQGMFSDYGMNMNGMNGDMSMGMNFNTGQGMYGGWDVQSNMWNGGPDKFNANAFANRMGADFGPYSGYPGYNMSQPQGNYPHMHQQQKYPSNEFHGSFGPYGRGVGRGRGVAPGGRGRGGYMAGMQDNYHSANLGPFQHQIPAHLQQRNGDPASAGANDTLENVQRKFNDELCPGGEEDMREHQSASEPIKIPENAPAADESSGENKSTPEMDNAIPSGLSAIPTTTELGAEEANLSSAAEAKPGPHSSGNSIPVVGEDDSPNYGPHYFHSGPGAFPPSQQPVPAGYGFSGEPRGVGVAGAPAAPRAMREGLQNTSIRNARGFTILGRASGQSTLPNVDGNSTSPTRAGHESRSRSNPRSRSKSRSRSRSPSRRSRAQRHRTRSQQRSNSRSRSPESFHEGDEITDRHRQIRRSRKGLTRERESSVRSRSSSIETSHRSSHRSCRDRDQRRDEKGTASHTSRRHRSSTQRDQLEESKDKASSKKLQVMEDSESRRLARVKEKEDRHRRRERERERDYDRSHRDRGEKDRDRQRHRDRNRDRDKERERERDKEKGKERDRGREKDRDRKRRRGRSNSRAESEHSRRHTRRARRDETDEQMNGSREKKLGDRVQPNGASTKPAAAEEKDPHTLEREARNRERLLKEQQRREAMNADRDGRSSRRRDGKLERGLLGGRRVSYKYEDEMDDQVRAARVEKEREAARWG
ncbi:hypothetical protein PRK78_002457 [Emydomyces testavorans]|uniref:Uncharacterized protein n=1 Tax=Emydomyces testavorans TaxID=2070801 RepID=A0AAF0IHL1_9EURO|nr:hypothetical protein PRK78_002457 [Emydomyces testavorans]